MNRSLTLHLSLYLGLGLLGVLTTGCEKKVAAQEQAKGSTGPEPIKVEPDLDPDNFKVDHPDQFPVAEAVEYRAAPELNVTGVVNPDVSRQVPVPSLTTGKIVEINARLGDTVTQGQVLFKVRSSDVAGAYSDYRKAVVNEAFAKVQLNRAKLLFDDGAIPRSSLEAAQNVEDNAVVDLDTTAEHLRLIGSDLDHPTGIVATTAPVSGVITDQQITNAAGVQALNLPAPFTISDVSHVWVVCDVWENQMSQVHLGEYADIHLVAYPNRVLKAGISNILPTIDPNIRTAKVRLEVDNPGLMRLGMFVTATFHGETAEVHASVPSTAILHLRDREWVYTPLGNGHFRRLEVAGGNMLPSNMQEVISGLKTGDKVVTNALVFQNTVEQ